MRADGRCARARVPGRARARPLARVLALGVCLAVAGAVAAPGQEGPVRIEADDPFPLRGEPVELVVTAPDGRPLPGVPVMARYRPNSEIVHDEVIGPTGPDGHVTWVPTDAGVVTLEVGGDGAGAPPRAQVQVSVRFGAFPPLGRVVMTIAAVLLFGGVATGFWLLLTPPRRPPAEEPPST